MRRFAVLMSAAVTMVAVCVVTSVCPYYTSKELIHEPAIQGRWINCKNPAETWTFDQPTNFACRLTLAEETKATVLETHAFKLNGQVFLDLFSREQDYHVIPAHYLLRVDQTAPSLKLSELDDAWLTALLTNNPAAIRHHVVQNSGNPAANRIILTASTAELQEFVLRHLKNSEAWKHAFELRPEKPPVETAQTKGLYDSR